MEKELIKYILELVGENDNICTELHKDDIEQEYCREHCTCVKEECVRRLMYKRIFNKND